ncbi:hypothetical protein Tco_1541425 [Tanacetum coccineum]
MEAHWIALELKNQAFKSGKHGQFLKGKSNEANVKHDIDAIDTINIELEHSVAKKLKQNEHLNKKNETIKHHYKELYDSIKQTRAKTIEHTTSLIAQNVDLKAKIREKGFENAALKNELRKITGSVGTNFEKPSILGKPPLHLIRNKPVKKDAESHKTTKRYTLVTKKSNAKKPERRINTGHRFSPKKSSAVHEKTMNPRSSPQWKPTGRIFKTIGLRWIPIGKTVGTCVNTNDNVIPQERKHVLLMLLFVQTLLL